MRFLRTTRSKTHKPSHLPFPIKNLHVTINGKSYFVGDYAEQQSNSTQFALENEKLISEFLRILSLNAVGIYSEKPEPIKVVSGLPVGYEVILVRLRCEVEWIRITRQRDSVFHSLANVKRNRCIVSKFSCAPISLISPLIFNFFFILE